MKIANYGLTVKKMEEAAYGMRDSLYHSLIFLLEPNQVFSMVAILLCFDQWQGQLRGLGTV